MPANDYAAVEQGYLSEDSEFGNDLKLSWMLQEADEDVWDL